MVREGNRDPESQGIAQAVSLRERLAAIPYTGAIGNIPDQIGLREPVLPHEIRPMRPGLRPHDWGRSRPARVTRNRRLKSTAAR